MYFNFPLLNMGMQLIVLLLGIPLLAVVINVTGVIADKYL